MWLSITSRVFTLYTPFQDPCESSQPPWVDKSNFCHVYIRGVSFMIRNTSTYKHGIHGGGRGVTCCARDRHQTWTNVVLAQVRVPYYACVSLYEAQPIICGQWVLRLSCYNTSYSTCVQQVVIAVQFALSHTRCQCLAA